MLSPLLFVIVMDSIKKLANQEGDCIGELTYTYDLVLISDDHSRVQEMVSNLDQQCKNYGMIILREKTEVSREPTQCGIDGEMLKHRWINSSTGSTLRKVAARRMSNQGFKRLQSCFPNFNLYLGTHTHIIKPVCNSSRLYQIENWTVDSKERQM